MEQTLKSINDLSERLEGLPKPVVWEDAFKLIEDQKGLISEAYETLSEDEKPLLADSIKRAITVHSHLVDLAKKGKSENEKEIMRLTHRKKMHSAYQKK